MRDKKETFIEIYDDIYSYCYDKFDFLIVNKRK